MAVLLQHVKTMCYWIATPAYYLSRSIGTDLCKLRFQMQG